jgi:hypothetical protein
MCSVWFLWQESSSLSEQIVALANGRCDQENVIEQLKNGVGNNGSPRRPRKRRADERLESSIT